MTHIPTQQPPQPQAAMPWIQTASGRAYPLVGPEAAHVYWPDVAESLAKLCRFNGHIPGYFYSVAQHCCHVADLLPLDMRGYGLLHDAHEAFLGDITGPAKQALKVLGAGDALDALETASDLAIFAAAGLPYPLPVHVRAQVKLADLVMLATERRDLQSAGPAWGKDLPDPAKFKINPWPWPKAMEAFMERFERWCPATTRRSA